MSLKTVLNRQTDINLVNAFDVKMEDFYQKASLVTGVQMTNIPATIVYGNVASRETVRISCKVAG